MACEPALRFASETTRYELRYGTALLPPGNPMRQRIVDAIVPRCTWLPIDAAVCVCTAGERRLKRDPRHAGLNAA